ncbi:MAG: polyhydroxyalkanoate depolymerase [Burkholderiales bacterium]
MLYALHELSHQMLSPWAAMARANRRLFSDPLSPLAYSPLAKEVAATSELFLRLSQRYEKPPFGLATTSIDGKDVAITEEFVLERPFCKLLHFKRDTTRKDPTVLLVAPLSGHHATLLRDTVRAMLPEHEVYITDWVDAKFVSAQHGPWHLDDYVDYIREFIRFLGPNVHVVSVCQPTVPVLVAVSLMAAAGEAVQPRTMTMMGGPIDPRKSPTAVNNLAIQKPYSWFEQNVIHRVPVKYPGYTRRVYPGFLQHFGFVAMNPERHANAHREYYEHLVKGDGNSAEGHRRFYDEYNAVIDMAAEYYLDTIKIVFQENRLANGTWDVRGERVRPERITKTALFTIEGELDDISGSGQTEAAHALCTGIPASKREHFNVPGVGHYGIFAGRRWREGIYPRIRSFIRKHG